MQFLSWASDDQAYSYDYWNNENLESKKVFSKVSTDLQKLLQDPHLTDIYNSFIAIVNAENLRIPKSNFLSLACGTCWLEALIARDYKPESITAVDFSRHRIHDLAPSTFRSIAPDYTDVTFVHGDILKIKKPICPYNFVVLSQAFHHVNQPVLLLKQITDNMLPGGKIIILGEHYFSKRQTLLAIVKHYLKLIIRKSYRDIHPFFPSYSSLFPPSTSKGDIHYSKSDYHFLFTSLGFQYKHFVHKESSIQSYILYI